MSDPNQGGGEGGGGGGEGNETTECSGCALQVSVNGGPGAPVTGGSGSVPYQFNEALDPTKLLATLMFTFDGGPGECDPNNNCAPKKPCKVKEPFLSVSSAVNGTLMVTGVSGPISPPRQIFTAVAGTTLIEPVNLPGGSGSHGDAANPYTVDLPCGGTSITLRIRFESWDPSVGGMNAQEVTITLTCTRCESAH